MREHPYSYVVVRCVPRVDREEFLNVGVVLHVQQLRDLRASVHVDPGRLGSAFPDLDVSAVEAAARAVVLVAEGDVSAGRVARETTSRRFGLLSAPRSSVLQPGPVHSGLTSDPGRTLAGLLSRYVT